MKTKITCVVLFSSLLCLILSACGKQGGPFVPEGVKDTYQKQYPAAE